MAIMTGLAGVLALAGSSALGTPDAVEAAAADGLATYPSAGMAIVQIQAGEVVSTTHVGEAGPGRPAEAQTLFNVGSITKVVTAELAHRLVDAGRMDLDASIAERVEHPDLGSDPRYAHLTPRLILSHQTGLLNWEYNYEDRKLAFTFDPGEGYSYSGAAYELLAEYMATIEDDAFETLVQTHVFDPMGVEAYLGAAAAPDAREVTPMDADGNYGTYRIWEQPPSAADNLFITGDDLARLLIAALAPEMEAVGPRTTPVTDISATQACGLQPVTDCPVFNGVSLGWSLTVFEGARYAYHGGADWAENAIAFINLDTGDGYVAMVNGGRGLGAWITALSILEPDHELVRFYAAIPEVVDWMAQTRAEPQASSGTSQYR